MLLLATQALPTMEKYRHPNLGRLLQPRHHHQARQTHEAGFAWAADNDAFNTAQLGWNDEADAGFVKMVEALSGVPGCKFAVCPDVPGQAGMTNLLWEEYAPLLWRHGLPPAYVVQNFAEEYGPAGCEYETWPVRDDPWPDAPHEDLAGEESASFTDFDLEDRWLPWGEMGALFIGGTHQQFREGLGVSRLVREAKRRGLWVHMGRVNSLKRMTAAMEMGCDSVDGLQWVKWRRQHLPRGLRDLAQLDRFSQPRLPL